MNTWEHDLYLHWIQHHVYVLHAHLHEGRGHWGGADDQQDGDGVFTKVVKQQML